MEEWSTKVHDNLQKNNQVGLAKFFQFSKCKLETINY